MLENFRAGTVVGASLTGDIDLLRSVVAVPLAGSVFLEPVGPGSASCDLTGAMERREQLRPEVGVADDGRQEDHASSVWVRQGFSGRGVVFAGLWVIVEDVGDGIELTALATRRTGSTSGQYSVAVREPFYCTGGGDQWWPEQAH